MSLLQRLTQKRVPIVPGSSEFLMQLVPVTESPNDGPLSELFLYLIRRFEPREKVDKEVVGVRRDFYFNGIDAGGITLSGVISQEKGVALLSVSCPHDNFDPAKNFIRSLIAGISPYAKICVDNVWGIQIPQMAIRYGDNSPALEGTAVTGYFEITSLNPNIFDLSGSLQH